MALKEVISVNVGSVPVVSYDATSDFTTDALIWDDFKGYSLNIWFNNLSGANPKPKIEFQASNTSDLLSFTTYENIKNISLPELFEDEFLTFKYIRFVYDSTGVGVGSTITFNLLKNTL
tara:strand:+ start:384 stop:740 length:357 start_codon:yes stop_codon:yes gene_type:complete